MCFDEGKDKFSETFFKTVLKVIKDKKDRFELKTLVSIIWSLAKIDLKGDSVREVLKDLRDYERLRNNLGSLY